LQKFSFNPLVSLLTKIKILLSDNLITKKCFIKRKQKKYKKKTVLCCAIKAVNIVLYFRLLWSCYFIQQNTHTDVVIFVLQLLKTLTN